MLLVGKGFGGLRSLTTVNIFTVSYPMKTRVDHRNWLIVIANLGCQVNRIYNHPEDKSLDMPVRDYKDKVNEVERLAYHG